MSDSNERANHYAPGDVVILSSEGHALIYTDSDAAKERATRINRAGHQRAQTVRLSDYMEDARIEAGAVDTLMGHWENESKWVGFCLPLLAANGYFRDASTEEQIVAGVLCGLAGLLLVKFQLRQIRRRCNKILDQQRMRIWEHDATGWRYVRKS